MPVADGVVLSLTALPGLTPAQEVSLRRIALHRVSDLLHFRAVYDAQLISALALGRVIHDVEITPLLDASAVGTAPDALLASPIDVLAAIDDDVARELSENFGVRTVAQLAAFAPFTAAQELVAARAADFSEPASAPAELLPTIVVRLDGVELLLDEDRQHCAAKPNKCSERTGRHPDRPARWRATDAYRSLCSTQHRSNRQPGQAKGKSLEPRGSAHRLK